MTRVSRFYAGKTGGHRLAPKLPGFSRADIGHLQLVISQANKSRNPAVCSPVVTDAEKNLVEKKACQTRRCNISRRAEHAQKRAWTEVRIVERAIVDTRRSPQRLNVRFPAPAGFARGETTFSRSLYHRENYRSSRRAASPAAASASDRDAGYLASRALGSRTRTERALAVSSSALIEESLPAIGRVETFVRSVRVFRRAR